MRNPRFHISNLDFRYYGSGVAATTSQRPYRTTTGMAGAKSIGLVLLDQIKSNATAEARSRGDRRGEINPIIFVSAFFLRGSAPPRLHFILSRAPTVVRATFGFPVTAAIFDATSFDAARFPLAIR